MKKYFTVYKITNMIDNKIYIGKHETDNLDDDYMGSGKHLKRAQKKYGMENFKKEILYILNTKKEMDKKESELVNEEFVIRKDVYNIKLGGEGGGYHTKGIFTVMDKNGNHYRVSKDDPRYLSGEFESVVSNKCWIHNEETLETKMCVIDDLSIWLTKGWKKGRKKGLKRKIGKNNITKQYGMVNVIDNDGNGYRVSKDDPRYLSGELFGANKGYLNTVDVDGTVHRVKKTDPRYLSGELQAYNKNMVTVKDKDGKMFLVKKTDPRYLSGELEFIWKGKKHTEEAKNKISKSKIKNKGV